MPGAYKKQKLNKSAQIAKQKGFWFSKDDFSDTEVILDIDIGIKFQWKWTENEFEMYWKLFLPGVYKKQKLNKLADSETKGLLYITRAILVSFSKVSSLVVACFARASKTHGA